MSLSRSMFSGLRAAVGGELVALGWRQAVSPSSRSFSSSQVALKLKYRKKSDSLLVRLTRPVAGLGGMDDLVEVSPGRMRRELFPNRQAVYIPWKTRSDLATVRELSQQTASTSSAQRVPVGKVEPRLSITFTCTGPVPDDPSVTVPDETTPMHACGHRSTHEFSRRSYEKGIVLVQCPECKHRHLIADHLGWFKEGTDNGRLGTIEDILRARGESVTKARFAPDGTMEYVEDSDTDALITSPPKRLTDRPIAEIVQSIAKIPDTIQVESAVTPDGRKLYGSVSIGDVSAAIVRESSISLEGIEIEWAAEHSAGKVREIGSYGIKVKVEGQEDKDAVAKSVSVVPQRDE